MANVNLIESNDISITKTDDDITLNVKKDSAVSTSSTKAVENQAITNYVDTEISGLETTLTTITEGTATPNSSYVSAVENNQWVKKNGIVQFSFTLTAGGSWGYTTAFLSGLPKPKYNTRFMALNHSRNEALRLELTINGEIQNAYSTNAPSSGNTLEGNITYISIE